jgi:uncharacterized membrane protein YjjP (DUF1212 family)
MSINVGPRLALNGRSGVHPDEEILFTLGRAMHQAGLPAHRIEAALGRVAQRLNLTVHSFSLPTGLLLCSTRDGVPTTVLFRLSSQPTNLEGLRRLMVEAEELASGRTSRREAIARIKRAVATPPPWGSCARVLGFALSAAAFSVFFGGGFRELLIASIVGLVVGLLALAFGPRRLTSRRFELVAAAAAGLISTVFDSLLGSYVHWIPLASGLIVLLPGLALVDSIEELANGHLASGSSRMAGVGIAFLALIFGVLLGINLGQACVGSQVDDRAIAFPAWAVLLALPVVAIGSMFRFQARAKEGIWILAASAVAFTGTRLGARLGDPLLGPFLGALLLGLTANIYARTRSLPPQILLIPGLALLVPGSFGVRSLDSLLSGDAATGVEQGFRMFMTSMALVAGLLFSNSLVKHELTSS